MLESLGQRQQSILRELLHAVGGLTLEQLASILSISRNAVAQHLNILEGFDYVLTSMLPSGGGRPSRAYHLSEAGKALFPKQYALFSMMLLKSIGETVENDVLEDLIINIGKELAEPFLERVSESPEPLEEVRLIMEELGYETMKAGSNQSEIVARNCVFHDLAKENRTICNLDRTLISTLLEREIEQNSCMAEGDDSCRFCISS